MDPTTYTKQYATARQVVSQTLLVTFRVRFIAWVFANRLPLYPRQMLPRRPHRSDNHRPSQAHEMGFGREPLGRKRL